MRLVRLLAVLVGLFVGGQAAASEPFSQSAFDAAQAAGKPIFIDVAAPWCPVCRRQGPIISELSKKPDYAQVVFFKLDFDSQKAELAKLKVSSQSTLIAFHGAAERGRSTGVTARGEIDRLIAASLK